MEAFDIFHTARRWQMQPSGRARVADINFSFKSFDECDLSFTNFVGRAFKRIGFYLAG
jgi:hypothetical protein